MVKGEFAQFVKEHYDKVRDKPARERLKVLGEMYRGGAKAEGGKPKAQKKKVKGAGFIGDFKGALAHTLSTTKPIPLGSMLTNLETIKKAVFGGELKKQKKTKGAGLDDTLEHLAGVFHPVNLLRGMFGGELEGKQQHGGGLLTDALGDLGPIGSLVPHLLFGGGLEGKKPRRAVQQMPLSLVPPSVPVDRATTKNTGVPGPLRSGIATSNPHEQAIALKRENQPSPFVQAQGSFIRQGPSRKANPESTDLKTMMGMFGMTMPPKMKNKQAGSKLTKADLVKVYKHTVNTHGEKGAGLFDDIARGFSQGFRLPFKAIGALI